MCEKHFPITFPKVANINSLEEKSPQSWNLLATVLYIPTKIFSDVNTVHAEKSKNWRMSLVSCSFPPLTLAQETSSIPPQDLPKLLSNGLKVSPPPPSVSTAVRFGVANAQQWKLFCGVKLHSPQTSAKTRAAKFCAQGPHLICKIDGWAMSLVDYVEKMVMCIVYVK